jgi:predicted DNA-binding transcriptional regulator AlpA
MTDDCANPAPLDARRAAAFLGVSISTLAKWRVSGKGPRFVKLGSKVAYRTSDLEDWLEAQTRMSTSDPGHALPNARSASVQRRPAKPVAKSQGRGRGRPVRIRPADAGGHPVGRA